MPDLGNASLVRTHCSTLKSLPSSSSSSVPSPSPLDGELEGSYPVKAIVNGCDWNLNLGLPSRKKRCNGGLIKVLRRCRGGVPDRAKKGCGAKCLEDYVSDWVHKKMESGASKSSCYLPFLGGGERMVVCRVCRLCIDPGDELATCSVRNCSGVYHSQCVKETFKVSNVKKFKCPQHECFVCSQRLQWRCVQCLNASHDKCAPWPDTVIHLINRPGSAICWRHPDDWRLDRHPNDWRLDKKEIFLRLPLPYVEEEFKIDLTWKGLMENKLEPPPYVHIRRNIYMVKKQRDGAAGYDNGCTNCGPICCENCVCRVQCISCSKSCRCSENCTNRPFRKDKKIRIVKTELCGWGVVAAESINKGDFVIEYIGEVISDALCEQRLWDMKYRGVQNFYMCEIRKNFTIDATYKGNTSRFLNHSCDPNCLLEKWQVEGETRVGIFAARSIDAGEPLTYDYRFVQFGPEVKCYCGASNCQGFLGTKRKVTTELNVELNIYWGAKRRRSLAAIVAI
ncbi:unnamed protein product [Linum tenue]|uniref:Histone-lysine N-methyltransferase ASHR3 n=1 Tax=Linum tenue TaxID=586396 RepID=A0AAV0IAC7_9ROSI|nr:unnamed protein product [Linum tenue]